MSQSWLAEECRHQAILFLAAESLAKGQGCPAPLLAEGSPLLRQVMAEAAEAANVGAPKANAIVSCVNAIFQAHASEGDAGIPTTPWTRAKLVQWWLQAGTALESLDDHQRDAFDKVTRAAGNSEHPAVWCAKRCGKFRLSIDGFAKAANKGDWEKPATTSGECRRKLFQWVVSPERPRQGLEVCAIADWYEKLRGEMASIVDDAVSLFGNSLRLRSGGKLQLATSDQWVAGWIDARLGSELLNEVRPPVVYSSQEGTKVLAKGYAFLQLAQAWISDLAQLPELRRADVDERGGGVQALARATEFARQRWHPGGKFATAWGKPGEAGFGALPIEAVEPAFLAVGRWLTMAWIVAEIDRSGSLRGEFGDLLEAMRISLALEGFRVRESRGGAAPARAIPHASRGIGGQRCLVLVRQSPACETPLGCLDEPASCAADLFAAIEAVDWRLWAFNTTPLRADDDSTGRVVEFLRRQVLRSEDWEAIKRQSLHTTGVPGDEPCLARLYTFANQRRLALELFQAEVYGEKPADAMLGGLIQEFRRLAQESLRALAAVSPAALCRLEPPRREDGAIDVRAWLARGGPAAQRPDEETLPQQIRWVRGSQPRGTLLEERRVGPLVEVVVSAGDAQDLELAVLNAPALTTGWAGDSVEEPAGRLADKLVALKIGIAFGPDGGGEASAGDPIAELRAAFAGEASPAFHELIARCQAGDEAAGAWVRILSAAPRFEFASYPQLDLESRVVRPPSLDDAFLEWEFDAGVPAGRDLALRFAITPAAARRVISLGPRRVGSVADRAELLAAACRQAGGRLAHLGDAARAASHRWFTLGSEAPHPLAMAEPLLDELLRGESAPPACRTAVFQAAAAWSESLDHGLLPAEWRADARLQPATFADVILPIEFDDQVPTGMVGVRRFGMRGLHGWPFSGVVSAGPAPAGYRELRSALDVLGNSLDVGHTTPHGNLARRADELAKHALSGTLPLALPNLFDRLWEAIGSVIEADQRPIVEAAASPLFEMLKGACRMIPFEPSKVGDYSAGWIREADGTQPRGRRIKRIVRPGLRTVENVLVRPALVITE